VRERICAPFFSPVPWWYSKGSSPPLVAGVTAPAAGNWAGDSTTDRLAQRSTHTHRLWLAEVSRGGSEGCCREARCGRGAVRAVWTVWYDPPASRGTPVHIPEKQEGDLRSLPVQLPLQHTSWRVETASLCCTPGAWEGSVSISAMLRAPHAPRVMGLLRCETGERMRATRRCTRRERTISAGWGALAKESRHGWSGMASRHCKRP
jgi:hypothetical protein